MLWAESWRKDGGSVIAMGATASLRCFFYYVYVRYNELRLLSFISGVGWFYRRRFMSTKYMSTVSGLSSAICEASLSI